jgi:hypothetical protein
MCFNIHPKYNRELIAKKDIVCYKYLDPIGNKKGRFISPFQNKIYNFNKKVLYKALKLINL